MSAEPLFAAVDLGASSGRVIVGDLSPDGLALHEVGRFSHPMRRRGGHLRWDLPRILREVKTGLRAAGDLSRQLRRPLVSVGVDTFGVDYGLFDAEGNLLEEPICYRDERTAETRPKVFARVPREELYARTGIQFLVFNTVFQLYEHVRAGLPTGAHHLLLMPDVLHHALCGAVAVEYTNATTTALVSARTRDWDRELSERLGIPPELLPPIVQPGTDLGPLREAVAQELALDGVRVVAPATHDTGSAVAGTPLEPGWAYISSGTWSLVGVERTEPIIDARALREDFTNEGGVYGTVRFLKNCMGLWLLESCKRQWEQAGRWVDYEALLPQVALLRDGPGIIVPDDQRLFNPPDMLAAIATQLRETGQDVPADPVALTRVLLDSLALRYARLVELLEDLTGAAVPGIQVVGGGSQNDYLSQATASATGKPVRCGPVEATALGNLVVQAIRAGRFSDLQAARDYLRRQTPARSFEPADAPAWQALRARYRALEARVLGS